MNGRSVERVDGRERGSACSRFHYSALSECCAQSFTSSSLIQVGDLYSSHAPHGFHAGVGAAHSRALSDPEDSSILQRFTIFWDFDSLPISSCAPQTCERLAGAGDGG